MKWILLTFAQIGIVNQFNATHEQKAIICSTPQGDAITAYTFEMNGYDELKEQLGELNIIEIPDTVRLAPEAEAVKVNPAE